MKRLLKGGRVVDPAQGQRLKDEATGLGLRGSLLGCGGLDGHEFDTSSSNGLPSSVDVAGKGNDVALSNL